MFVPPLPSAPSGTKSTKNNKRGRQTSRQRVRSALRRIICQHRPDRDTFVWSDHESVHDRNQPRIRLAAVPKPLEGRPAQQAVAAMQTDVMVRLPQKLAPIRPLAPTERTARGDVPLRSPTMGDLKNRTILRESYCNKYIRGPRAVGWVCSRMGMQSDGYSDACSRGWDDGDAGRLGSAAIDHRCVGRECPFSLCELGSGPFSLEEDRPKI
jgi:hypothetical protein